MYIWGITKRYKNLSWWTNFMGGHLSIGPVTIYGSNAMNWAVNISTRWGYVCFTLPVIARIRRHRHTGKMFYDWYFYISPDATPCASTFYRGAINRTEH